MAGAPEAPTPSPSMTPPKGDPLGLSLVAWPASGPDVKALLVGLPDEINGFRRNAVQRFTSKAGPVYQVRYGGTREQPEAVVFVQPVQHWANPATMLVVILAWLKDCANPKGHPATVVDNVLILDSSTAGNQERNRASRELEKDEHDFVWFSCTAQGEVGDPEWNTPRDEIAWSTSDSAYWIEARKGSTAERLIKALIAAAQA
jgi:hypothetical protein